MSKSNEKVEQLIEKSCEGILPPAKLRDDISDLVTNNLQTQTKWDDLKLISMSLAVVLLVSFSIWAMFKYKTHQIRKQLGLNTAVVMIQSETTIPNDFGIAD